MTYYEFEARPDIDDPDFDPNGCVQVIEASSFDEAAQQSEAARLSEEQMDSDIDCWLYDGSKLAYFICRTETRLIVDRQD